jgi:hypothetical protein
MEDRGFKLDQGVEILERTPALLRVWLSGLSEDWIMADEGPETWNPFEVVGHLIHGERTDWIPRAEHILAGKEDEPFPPFDRFAQARESKGKTMEDLLNDFEVLRRKNLEVLGGLGLLEEDLQRKGTHPEFGSVNLGQLLATWVTHDLAHLGQIARVMAKRHTTEVGPWRKYLSILDRK